VGKYLVKARVEREGSRGDSIRFVPLEIFDLWKSHMKATHGCEISTVQISLWVVAESGGAALAGTPSASRERVVEVRFVKKVGSATMPVERYIPQDDLETVLPILLAHYGIRIEDAEDSGVVLRPGFFLSHDEIFGPEFG
jgi:hypothetical protein